MKAYNLVKMLGKNYKIKIAILHDLLAIIFSWFFAFILRFNFEVSPDIFSLIKSSVLVVLIIQLSIFHYFNIYKGVWRFATLTDLKRIFYSVFSASIIILFLFMFVSTSLNVPRSIFVLYPMILIFIMGGNRIFYRIFKENHLYNKFNFKGEPVIIIGAGDTASLLVKELRLSSEWQVVGFLDDDKSLHQREISGIKVLGSTDELSDISKLLKINKVIIAIPSNQQIKRKKALELANKLQLQAMTIPGINDLMSGRLNVSQIRRVEVEDLLGRDIVDLDNDGLQKLIQSKTVLVSGAGGSIGSELCKQIVRFKPEHLICIDISEYAIYQLEQYLQNLGLKSEFSFLVGDIKNSNRINKIFKEYNPDIVFHAAAYKHVPLMESINLSEAFHNNVIGTYKLAKASLKAKVSKFILISTDKAINPTNIMGATKRLAEMICQGLETKNQTDFLIVRFGNVLGSSGSVIPKFRSQIKNGGPITVTDRRITRYFMAIPEAAQLVLQAALIGKGGEIFVLDMGKPVNIAQLAKDMIRLSGLKVEDIKIKYIGLRPGEKLYEELLADDEKTLPTIHEKIRIASARNVSYDWVLSLLKWISKIKDKDEKLIKKELKHWVNEYKN